MNRNWSQVKIVESILKIAGSDEASVCQQLNLEPVEYGIYCENLEKRGFVVVVDDGSGVIQVTDAGKALLQLISGIDALVERKKEVHSLEQVVEIETWSTECAERETEAWREKIFENYIQERLEVEKLEARLAEGHDEAVSTEMERRYQRLAEMQRLLDKMGYVIKELRDNRSFEVNTTDSCPPSGGTKKEDIKLLADRLFRAYVLEQADIVRMQVQLQENGDSGMQEEFQKRLERLGVLKNLFEVLNRVIENQPR